ncbi:MAG TPA: CBS domain-containing protein [Longimicrobiales bacterium]|nr:CBS domain-containing protein [Longimicrobiales bacterium]
MTLADWLAANRIEVPLAVETLEEALAALLRRAPEAVFEDAAARAKCARDLAFGSRGEVVRIGDEAVLVASESEDVEVPVLFLGVSVDPFVVTAEGREDPGQARAVVLALVPGRMESFRARVVPVLRKFLATGEGRLAVYAARSPDEIVTDSGLLDLEIPNPTGVASAIRPVTYRVYPDTPVAEIYELMTRRKLHAVPVVGENYEVLGVITAGDALRHLVPHTRGGQDAMEAVKGSVARDVMTRAVLCVSEDQTLVDVASLMVNRDVEQLPVVREGELVGFVTREAVLRALLVPGLDSDDA